MKSLFVFLALLAIFPRPAPAASGSAAAAIAKSWNHWYTVTILPGTRYAYYHETLEKNRGRLHFKTEMWKKEEGFINSEQLGVFSEDNADLTPLFYNFHANYRQSEASIDGTASNGRLQIRIRKNGTELPVMTRGIPGKAFFSSLFPVWMARKLRDLPAGSTASSSLPFTAILEDNQDAGFPAETGRLQVAAPDEHARSTSTIRIQVDFNGQKSTWYLDKSGAPARIEIPGQNTRVERVTEKQAKAFLEAP